MTFLNDLWKKFKSEGSGYPIQDKGSDGSSQDTAVIDRETSKKPSSMIENASILLNNFEQNELENLQKETVLSNLQALKAVVNEPKEEKPELRFTKIKQHLGEPECHETVRQERWPVGIHCPNCRSENLNRLPQMPPQSLHNHRYCCLDCHTTFNDDSDTPMEKSPPPLNVWMQCWYLMGCTDSLNYIAAKLNLDISIIENMVLQLQKIFNAKKPLTRFLGYEEWSKQSQHLRDQLKEDLLKQYERLNANIATAPKDTAEFRRQQNIRRGLTTIEPPSPNPGKKR